MEILSSIASRELEGSAVVTLLIVLLGIGLLRVWRSRSSQAH